MRTARPAEPARAAARPPLRLPLYWARPFPKAGTHFALTRPCGSGSSVLTLPVQHADQREQPARGFEIDPHLALQAFLQRARALVVDAAAPHVDGLDLVRRSRPDRLVVAVADHEIVFHDPPERRQRQ